MSRAIDQTLQLALDIYAAPLQYRNLLDHGIEIPQDFPEFLKFVARDDHSPEMTERAGQLDVSPLTLKQACYFYIRQALFHDAKNYYRILGVADTATDEAIRLNYHLLIRLFHPDRNPEGDSWNELFAPLLNEAYNTLKRAGSRQGYDRARDDHARAATPPETEQEPVARRELRRKQYTPRDVAPGVLDLLYQIPLWQKHPKLLIWGTLVFLLSLFLAILILNAQAPLAPAGGSAITPRPGQAIAPRADRLAGVTQDDARMELPHYLRSSESTTILQGVAQSELPSAPKTGPRQIAEPVVQVAEEAGTEAASMEPPKKTSSPLPTTNNTVAAHPAPLPLAPSNLNLEPKTLPLAPSNLNLEPCPLNLAPCSLNLEPKTLPLAPNSSPQMVDTDRQLTAGVDKKVAKLESPKEAQSPAPAVAGQQTAKPSEKPAEESPDYLRASASKMPRQGVAQSEPTSIPENSSLGMADTDRQLTAGVGKKVAKLESPKEAQSPAPAVAGQQTAKPSQQEPTSAQPANAPDTGSMHTRNAAPNNTVAAHPAPLPLAPSNLDLGPKNLPLAPSNLNLGPKTLPLAPSNLNLAPSNLNLEPCPLNLAPCSLNLEPNKPLIQQAEQTLFNYLAAYETGDLTRLLPLFSERVETDDGIGIAIIENDYGNLFQKTRQRRMVVHRAVWQKEPGGVRLSSEVEVRVLKNRREGWLRFAGTMDFHFTQGENSLQIVKLVHQLKQKN